MARTVEDAAAMLSVMAGSDMNDVKTALIPFDEIPDYYVAAKRKDISRYRLGIPRNALGDLSPATLESFESIVKQLAADGAKVVDINFPGMTEYSMMSLAEKCDYMAGEFHDAIAKYFSNLITNPNGLTNLEDLRDFVKESEGEEFPERGVQRFEQALEVTRDSVAYNVGRQRALYFAGVGGIEGAFDIDRLDAILVPSEATAANYFAACNGHPQITVPVGFRPQDTEVKKNETGNLTTEAPNMP